MILTRFLPFLFFTFLFSITSYAQFALVKNFDGGPISSFQSRFSQVVYSLGSKVLVQYDSVDVDHYVNSSLASIDVTGASEVIASAANNMDVAVFFDFKTLPGGKVAFVDIESATSFKIIITDGTTAGTFTAYTSGSPIKGLELIGNGLYFTCDAVPNRILKKIELTTFTVTTVSEFSDSYMISDISKISNTSLIFMAADPADNILKVYVSDGTSAGTTALAVINTGDEFWQNTAMTQVGNKVYFFYRKQGTDCCYELWVTDGTVSGSKRLKDFSTLYLVDFVRENKVLAFNDKFYFAGVQTGESIGDEVLWVSDGTTEGTIALTEVYVTSRAWDLLVFDHAVYFLAYNSIASKPELWKTDGTLAGTSIVDIRSNGLSVFPMSMAANASYIYVAGADVAGPYYSKLFRFDGSTSCSILDDPNFVNPTNMYVNGSDVYFIADNGTGEELCTTGGDFSPAVSTGIRSSASAACTVYPNPAKDVVYVKSPEQIKSLRLVNQFGYVLAVTTESTLQLDSYSEGIYFIEVELIGGDRGYEKIIITK